MTARDRIAQELYRTHGREIPHDELVAFLAKDPLPKAEKHRKPRPTVFSEVHIGPAPTGLATFAFACAIGVIGAGCAIVILITL